MEPALLDPGGIPIERQALEITRAQSLAEAVASGMLDFVRLVECRRRNGASGNGDAEIVVLDLDIQRPQLTVHDIRRSERVAVILQQDDGSYPEVLALRSDFPLVPHLNLRHDQFPRSLCLYDQGWDEVRTRWTATAFIERIRLWLADTATGTLHRDDQPLEPLLFGTSYRLVIPSESIKGTGEASEKLDLALVETGEHRGTFIARNPRSPHRESRLPPFVASMFIADARHHGVISHAPKNLSELCDFVKGETFDLLAQLRERLKRWKDDGCLDSALIIVIAFPLKRETAKPVEISDIWAFMTLSTIFDVGKNLGVWEKVHTKNTSSVGLLLSPDESQRGTDIILDVVRPHFSFSRTGAATASGHEPVRCKTVAIGVGALGSQVIMNLVRSGFGAWTLIDEDVLMPHNLARHALPPWCVGAPKAEAVAAMIDGYYEEETPTQSMVVNVLKTGQQKPAIDAAFTEADLILDFAASVPVARHLARHVESPAKRMSLFLNPCGSDLICLSEDAKRTTSLDCLELQYYRAMIKDERLCGHLNANSNRVRYARSCRDLSVSLPTYLVSLHAAIGAHAVRLASISTEPTIRVWRSDPVTCAVTAVDVPVHRVQRSVMGEWTLIIDDWLIRELSELRLRKLPNETGGVLIGSYDLPSRTVYVVDTVPSPPDSEEWPTLYIRGSDGLQAKVSAITEMTAGQLEYVGEWHSHPDGYSCLPSDDDVRVFSWITDRMSAAGLPALIAIIGDGRSSMWFVANIERDGGWQLSTE